MWIELVVLVAVALGVAWWARNLARRPRRPDVHVEYTLLASGHDDPRLAELTDRLAAAGRGVRVRLLDEAGQPAAAPPAGTPLVGTQVELHLAGAEGGGRVLLRLRREPDGGVFGLLEVDDDASFLHRRLAAAIVRELRPLLRDLAYASFVGGVPGKPRPASALEANETL